MGSQRCLWATIPGDIRSQLMVCTEIQFLHGLQALPLRLRGWSAGRESTTEGLGMLQHRHRSGRGERAQQRPGNRVKPTAGFGVCRGRGGDTAPLPLRAAGAPEGLGLLRQLPLATELGGFRAGGWGWIICKRGQSTVPVSGGDPRRGGHTRARKARSFPPPPPVPAPQQRPPLSSASTSSSAAKRS